MEIDAQLKKDGAALTPADRGLYTRLVYGVTERRLTLDHIIDSLASHLGPLKSRTSFET